MWKLIHNKEQNSLDTLKVHVSDTGCCGKMQTECKYTFTTNFSNPIVSVTIGGKTSTFAVPASTYTMLKAGINDALVAMGYEDWDNVGTRFDDSGLWVTGQAVIDKISTSSADIEPTVECVKVSVCEYKVTIVGSVPTVTANGSTTALDPTTYAYTSGDAAANTAKAAEFKGAIEDGLDTLSDEYTNVTVEVNDLMEAFDVTILGYSDAVYLLAQKELKRCDCWTDYK